MYSVILMMITKESHRTRSMHLTWFRKDLSSLKLCSIYPDKDEIFIGTLQSEVDKK